LTIGILFCRSTMIQLVLVILLGLSGFIWGRIPAEFRKFIYFGLPTLLIIFLIHLFYHQGESLFKVWFFNATVEGLKAGILISLRFLNFGLVAILMLSGISPVEFGRRLAWLLGLFRWRALADLSLVFFIAIRFVPSLVKESGLVKLAMIARGADFGGSVVNRSKRHIQLLLPLFSRVIRQADDIACAISLKGYRGIYLVGNRPEFQIADILLTVSGIIVSYLLVIS
jgi:energy-coupling factor transporter transmembrane protein EcfT